MNTPRGLRLRSLRLRIALLSAAVSGVALAVSGSLTLAAMHRITLARMDNDIKEFAHRQLVDTHGRGHWARVNDSLRFFLKDQDGQTYILLVKDQQNRELFVSPNWPPELSSEDYPQPDAWGRYEDAPEDRPPPRPAPPLLDQSPQPPAQDPLARPLRGPQLQLKVPEFSSRPAGGTFWRLGMMGNPEVTFVLGLNQRRLNEEVAQVRYALLAILPAVLLIVALGAAWISQRALKPLREVTDTMRRVRARGLDQRAATTAMDREFAGLINMFNEMMDWVEANYHQAIRFSADASHELKTPLTVLQAYLEQAIQEAPPGSAEQQRYVAFGEELQRLKSITQKLLLLSRIDAGELAFHLRPVNLSQLVEGAAEDAEILAPALRIESDIEPEHYVLADAELLKQVVQNLTANAIKYNIGGGFIRMGLSTREDRAVLTITNSGSQIAEADRDRVFTRFFRGDRAHGRAVSGAGLGLSIAREIARAHQGDLTLEDSPEGEVTFALNLPCAAVPPEDVQSRAEEDATSPQEE